MSVTPVSPSQRYDLAIADGVSPSSPEIPPGMTFSQILAATKGDSGNILSPTSAAGGGPLSGSSVGPTQSMPYNYFDIVPSGSIFSGPVLPGPTVAGAKPTFFGSFPAHADEPGAPGGEEPVAPGPGDEPSSAYASYLEAQSSADDALGDLRTTNDYASKTQAIYTQALTLAAPSEKGKVEIIQGDVEITQVDQATAANAALKAQAAADAALDAAFANDPEAAAAQATIAGEAAASAGVAANDAKFHYEEALNTSNTLMGNNPDLLNLPKWPEV